MTWQGKAGLGAATRGAPRHGPAGQGKAPKPPRGGVSPTPSPILSSKATGPLTTHDPRLPQPLPDNRTRPSRTPAPAIPHTCHL